GERRGFEAPARVEPERRRLMKAVAARRPFRLRVRHRLTDDGLARRLRRIFLLPLQVLAEVAVPWRDDDGYRAGRLRLTRKTYERSRLTRLDVAEERHHLSLAPVGLRQLLRAAEHADPACAARGRATLHGYRPLIHSAARVEFVPGPLVGRRARRDLLHMHGLE